MTYYALIQHDRSPEERYLYFFFPAAGNEVALAALRLIELTSPHKRFYVENATYTEGAVDALVEADTESTKMEGRLDLTRLLRDSRILDTEIL